MKARSCFSLALGFALVSVAVAEPHFARPKEKEVNPVRHLLSHTIERQEN
jgi:hypothetical protein